MTTSNEQSSSEARFEAWWNQWRKGFDPGVTDGDVMSDMNSSEGAWEAQEAYWHEQLAAEKLVSEGLRENLNNALARVTRVEMDRGLINVELQQYRSQLAQMTRDIQRKDEALKIIAYNPEAPIYMVAIAERALKSLDI